MERLGSLYGSAITELRSLTESLRSLWNRESKPIFRMNLVTGDRRGAGTNANVYIIIHDAKKRKSKTLRPQQPFKDDYERGSTTSFDFGLEDGVSPPFKSIEIWRDDYGSISLPFGLNRWFYGDDQKDSTFWFLDRIEISLLAPGSLEAMLITHGGSSCAYSVLKDSENNITPANNGNSHNIWYFPIHRWINSGSHYEFPLFDSLLPQYDHRALFRLEELDHKRRCYIYAEKVKGGPVQVESLPSDENFSEKFFWTFVEKKTSLMAYSRFISWTSPKWTSLDDIKDIFKLCLKPPPAIGYWKEDWWFGIQRLQGVNPTLVELCESLPEQIDAPVAITTLIEGRTLSEAIQAKRIFLCDLSILEGIRCKNNRKVAAPTALFYLDSGNKFLPILIQLQQMKTKNTPVYTPLDSPYTWLVAKMFYNNAEAQFHQSLTHLAFTHLVMEGVCAAYQRCLSPSHPIFRLLAPHFLYLIAINKRGEEKLVNPGGWVDSTMTQGIQGMADLIEKRFQKWHFGKLNPLVEIKERSLLDPNILPYYPYRDDAVEMFHVIYRYVSKIVSRYYVSLETLKSDWEIQNFRSELVSAFPRGLGLVGIPGTDKEGFTNLEELIETISCIISTCSIGHAAANSQQYDQYAFVPNYPALLDRDPPTIKEEFSEIDIDALMPSKEVTLDIIVITNLLSTAITNPLGDFEVKYLYHPKDQEALDNFREELRALNSKIVEENKKRKLKYEDLLPSLVPNSISI